MRIFPIILVSITICGTSTIHGASSRQDFDRLGNDYLEQLVAYSPVRSTGLGDHRFDHLLDDISDTARQERTRWLEQFLARLQAVKAKELPRHMQVDYALLLHAVQSQIWNLKELRQWKWNPLIYTGLAGDSIYSLMARDFEPLESRLVNASRRLEEFPRFLKQVRETLDPSQVPSIHAKTAISQNRGVISTIKNMVRPHLDQLPAADRNRLELAMKKAVAAIGKHQTWLESVLLPQAKGNFRLGIKRYEKKLYYSLHSPLRRQEIRNIANARVKELHRRMYLIAKALYREEYPLTRFPSSPSDSYRRAIIRFGLEKAYADAPKAGEIVATAKDSATAATNFVRANNLISLMPDPLEIIVMPEFQRGVSLAYCDSPGALETNQKTYYAVSPIPKDWSAKQIRSHLREYNNRSVDVLTMHEAVPGHFLQLAHANRYRGKLRHLLQSGTFVEGWAVYTEWMMCQAGYRDHDPLLKLVTLKWYLRDVANAILDHGVHVDEMTREEAMRLMTEDAFQEEREAAGKWTRARLTSGQLSTYFVGYLEHVAMREKVEAAWGDEFTLKKYHDQALSFGSPPPQYVQALLLEQDIPLPH